MREQHLQYLVCPYCAGELKISRIDKKIGASIETGQINCLNCRASFGIIRHIPRFVSQENYAESFGFEWLKHPKTQYDSYTGANISEKRFFEETKWPRDLKGEIILEAGCGAGRFTEQVLKTGAMVVAMDYSRAVEANYQSHGDKENVLIVQADIYQMPFRKNFFDRIFCFGVLQHLPDVKKGFMCLVDHLKPGGKLAIDVYRKTFFRTIFYTKYWVRPLTKRMKPEKLYKLCEKWVNFIWPLTRWISKLPKGRYINKILFLLADYTGYLPLSESLLKEWAILDTFDMLSPYYDKPQTLKTVRKWFEEAGLKNVEVQPGYNGIEGRGEK